MGMTLPSPSSRSVKPAACPDFGGNTGVVAIHVFAARTVQHGVQRAAQPGQYSIFADEIHQSHHRHAAGLLSGYGAGSPRRPAACRFPARPRHRSGSRDNGNTAAADTRYPSPACGAWQASPAGSGRPRPLLFPALNRAGPGAVCTAAVWPAGNPCGGPDGNSGAGAQPFTPKTW